jgi:phosphohistidine phosphatase
VRVLLLRHAIAAARDPQRWPQDRGRPLTPGGRRRMQRAARGLRAYGVRCDLVLTSPFERALQTAKIVAAILRPRPEVRILKPLSPGGGPAAAIAALSETPADACVMLVGHEPDLSGLAAVLLLDRPADLSIVFRKGGLCRIDFDGPVRSGGGVLVYHLPPRALRRLRLGRRA